MVWLYRNWTVPGLQVAAIEVTLNTIAVLHGGKMPVFEGADRRRAELADLVGDPYHGPDRHLDREFVRAGGMFGDVVPIPIPVIRDVISVGDVLLWVGIVWAITAAMTRRSAPTGSRCARREPSTTHAGRRVPAGVAYATAMPLAAEAGRWRPRASGAAAAPAGTGVALEEGASPRTCGWPPTATTPCCGAASWSASWGIASTRLPLLPGRDAGHPLDVG